MTLGTDCPPLLAPATFLLNSYSVWFWMSGTNYAFYCCRSCRNLKASPGCSPLGLNRFSQKYTHALDPHPYWSTHAPTLKTNRQTPPNPPPSVTTSEEWSACGGGGKMIAAESDAFNHLTDAVGLHACSTLLFGYEGSSKRHQVEADMHSSFSLSSAELVQIMCQTLLKDWPVIGFCWFVTWLRCKNSLPILAAKAVKCHTLPLHMGDKV